MYNVNRISFVKKRLTFNEMRYIICMFCAANHVPVMVWQVFIQEKRLSLGEMHSEAGNGDAARPVHPGVVLREEFLLPMKLTASALAIALQVPAPRINEIVRERRGITADTALRLARYFGNTPAFWMRLQDEYDLRVSLMSMGDALERIQPRVPV